MILRAWRAARASAPLGLVAVMTFTAASACTTSEEKTDPDPTAASPASARRVPLVGVGVATARSVPVQEDPIEHETRAVAIAFAESWTTWSPDARPATNPPWAGLVTPELADTLSTARPVSAAGRASGKVAALHAGDAPGTFVAIVAQRVEAEGRVETRRLALVLQMVVVDGRPLVADIGGGWA